MQTAYIYDEVPLCASQFTGKERDSETGLDYFGARYYGSNMGRWMSPDWSAKPDPVPYSDLHDPQSLNLYGYVRNNPLSRADIDGHDFWDKLNNLVHGNGWKDTPPPPPPPPPAPPQQTPPAANPPAQQNPVNYRPGVPPAAGNLANTVNCIQNCARQPITVTSTNEAIPQHPADSPHGRGQAADLRVRPGTEHEVLGCAAQCGAQFGLDERAHPSAHATGPHVHIQLTPGRNGGRGDLPANQTPQEEE